MNLKQPMLYLWDLELERSTEHFLNKFNLKLIITIMLLLPSNIDENFAINFNFANSPRVAAPLFSRPSLKNYANFHSCPDLSPNPLHPSLLHWIILPSEFVVALVNNQVWGRSFRRNIFGRSSTGLFHLQFNI